MLTTATINRLPALYPQGQFEVRRFRPNTVVLPENDDAEFVESKWVGRELRICDDVVLAITDHCPRCVMTTTLPQGHLPEDSGILRKAARHNEVTRRRACIRCSPGCRICDYADESSPATTPTRHDTPPVGITPTSA